MLIIPAIYKHQASVSKTSVSQIDRWWMITSGGANDSLQVKADKGAHE